MPFFSFLQFIHPLGRLAGLVLAVALVPDSLAAGRRLEVLFLGDTGHHRPAERFPEIYRALGPKGINFTFTAEMADLNPENLARYDALMIFANWTEIAPDQEKALLDYVRGGRGFLPIHCASYCFLNSARYTALVGARFKSHGTGTFQTTLVAPDHPVMRGFHPFETWDETYVHERHQSDRVVLQEREGEPYTWLREEGKGRVFYTAYGHDSRTWTNPGFHNLLERGLRWAVGTEAAAAWDALALAPLEYVDDPGVPNYERREPPPKLQKPLPPAEAQKHIAVPAGMDLTLFASESDGLWNVIEFKFDERGRLWTCESLDYPNEIKRQGEGRDRIRILEDTNGDGKADKASTFADKLSIPTSLAFANGGVVVLAIPHTLFLKDTNGDDRADEEKILFTGWGTGDTHASASNLIDGPDGWLYACVGYSGFNGTVGGERLRFGSGVCRFTTDGSKLEFLGGTSNNTWGLAFDENGDLFGSTANNQSSFYLPIPRRYYATTPGLEPGILPGVDANKKCCFMREYIRQVDVFGGFTAAAGHNFYTARAFPQKYWNRVAFIAEPTCHLLYQGVAASKGAGFTIENGWNLMASDDEWFAPVFADVGPDGAVWVSDFYSFLIQHNPTPTSSRGGFRASTGRGNAFVSDLRDTEHARLWRIMPKGATPSRSFRLSRSDPDGLLAALDSDNFLWRRHAQRLLVERGNPDVAPRLRERIASAPIDAAGISGAAFHALWTLHGLGQADLPTLTGALKHPASGVRRAAARILPRSPEGLDALVAARTTVDPDPLVRLTALLVLSEMPEREAIGRDLYALANDRVVAPDRWLPTALTIAAARHAAGYLAAALEDGAVTSSGKAPEPTNLLANGGFEEVVEAQPAEWKVRTYSGRAEHSVAATGRTGNRSVEIRSDAGADTSWHFDLDVEPASDYVLSGWIRTENLATRRGGRGAMIQLHQLNGTQPHTPPVLGTRDWTRVELPFHTGPQRRISINLLYGGWGHATGTARWDDLSLVRSATRTPSESALVPVAAAFARSADHTAKAALREIAGKHPGPTSDLVVRHLDGAAPVARAETVEDLRPTHQVLDLSVVTGQMKFDKERLEAKAGKPIVIAFRNPDPLQHNVIVGTPGSLEKIGAAANAMMTEPDGFTKAFKPDLPEVLGGTPLVNPGERALLKLPALEPGDYTVVCTFPGHWLLMRSTLAIVP